VTLRDNNESAANPAPSDVGLLRAACDAARRVDCGQCAALAGDECVYTTAPVSAPVAAGTPVRPVRGYHAGRLALAGNLVPGLVPAAIVWDNVDAPRYASLGLAHGPYQTEQQAREDPAVRAVHAAFRASPGTGRMTPHCHRILSDACSAAGVEAGAYDRRILAWLAEWGPETCAVVAGLITRAHEAAAAARGKTETSSR